MDVTHGKDEMWLTQHTFIRKALQEYGLDDSRVDALAPSKELQHKQMMANAVAAEQSRRSRTTTERQLDERKRAQLQHTSELYRQLVGSLLFATRTRPDIAHAVGMLGRLLEGAESKSTVDDPVAEMKQKKKAAQRRKERMEAMQTLNALCADMGAVDEDRLVEDHFEAAQHVFRYLKRTMQCGLHYWSELKKPASEVKQSDVRMRVEVYSDSDLGGDVRDGKSTTGWVVLVNGMVVDWTSSKQTVVARSTLDAENNAMADAIESGKWMYAVLSEMGFSVDKTVAIWGDNDANNNVTRRERRFDPSRTPRLNYHFIVDELFEQCSIEIKRVDSKDNLADLFTKPIKDQQRFRELCGRLISQAPVQKPADALSASEGKGKVMKHRGCFLCGAQLSVVNRVTQSEVVDP